MERHTSPCPLVDPIEEFLEIEDQETQLLLDLPSQPAYANKATVIDAKVGEISAYLNSLPADRRVIHCDCEWKLGAKRADVVIVGLDDGRTFVFQVSRLNSFPSGLKLLLQNPAVKKCGNRINTDVDKLKGWKVNLSPVYELGHLAHARCVSPRKNPSIQFLLEALFGCTTPKGRDSPRLSNWDCRQGLSSDQIQYCGLDGYAGIMIFLKLMTIMNPHTNGKLQRRELKPALTVTLFNHELKSKAAIAAIIDAKVLPGGLIRVAISKPEAVFTPESYIPTMELDQEEDTDTPQHSESTNGLTTLGSVSHILRATGADNVEFCWPVKLVRRYIPQATNIAVCRKEVIVEKEFPDDEDSDVEWDAAEDAEDAAAPKEGGDASDESSTGSADQQRRIPKLNRKRRYYRLRKERIKNDILHIFLRFDRVLSKEHGAYANFMSALRDALYIACDEDLELVRELLKEAGYSDKEIEKKLGTEFDWCLKRIRRQVPAPKELEKRYQEVVELYKDIVDAKTEKAFFSNRALRVHKSTLKHIRRNCLSDIPGVSYYIQVGKDRLGIPLYKCIRGTSALEGFHQKLRTLVRGYSNSPRFVRALMHEFIYRWNHDLEVTARSLPKDYELFYEGSALEKEIKIMRGWKEQLDAHPEWNSTMDFRPTGETFGIPSILEDLPPLTVAFQCTPGSEEDKLRDDDAANAEEAACELEAGDASNDQVEACLVETAEAEPKQKRRRTNAVPPSLAWLSKHSGRQRPTGKVRGKAQWDYFRSNYTNYMGGGSSTTADNYSCIDFSAFAAAWNEKVAAEEQAGVQSDFTYKTSAILMDAWVTHKRQANRDTTMLGHQDAANDLRKRLRDTAEPTARNSEFPPARQAQNIEKPNNNPIDDSVQAVEPSNDSFHPAAEPPPRKRHRKKKSRVHRRCRKCGQEYSRDEWKGMHPSKSSGDGETETDKRLGNLAYRPGNKPEDRCIVPEDQYAEGFPIPEGQLLPRRRTKQNNNNNEE